MRALLYTVKKEVRDVPGPGFVERSFVPLDTGAFWKPGIAAQPDRTLKHTEYKHFVHEGRDVCIGMDMDTKDALAFLWYEERTDLEEKLELSEKRLRDLRVEVRTFNASPWYSRMWLALRRQVP